MSAIPISAKNTTDVHWGKASVGRDKLSGTYSESGKVSNELWDEIQKRKIKTVTTPPDDIRLQRELSEVQYECSVENWNGYDAKPLERQSVEYVCNFLQALPSDISYPELGAEPNGDLTMIWNKRGYYVVIGIDPTATIAWGGTGPDGNVFGHAKFDKVIPKVVLDLLNSIEGNR